jgi:hypothetical protein
MLLGVRNKYMFTTRENPKCHISCWMSVMHILMFWIICEVSKARHASCRIFHLGGFTPSRAHWLHRHCLASYCPTVFLKSMGEGSKMNSHDMEAETLLKPFSGDVNSPDDSTWWRRNLLQRVFRLRHFHRCVKDLLSRRWERQLVLSASLFRYQVQRTCCSHSLIEVF